MPDASYQAATTLLRTLEGQPGACVELEDLYVQNAHPETRAELEAAIGSLALSSFSTLGCGWQPAFLPRLCAVALHGSLTKLSIRSEMAMILGAGAELNALLAAAAPSLTELTLADVVPFACGAGALMHAVWAHSYPRLEELVLCEGVRGNGYPPRLRKRDREAQRGEGQARGPCDSYSDDSSEEEGQPDYAAEAEADEEGLPDLLAAFLKATPTLRKLHLPWLSTATLAPLLLALRQPRNRLSDVSLNVRDLTEPWLRDALLPALREVRRYGSTLRFRLDACALTRRLRDMPSYERYSELVEELETEKPEPAEMEEYEPRWADWRSAPDPHWDGAAFDADRSAYWKASVAAGKLRTEERRIRLRPSPSPQRPWQQGGALNVAALPQHVLAQIWRHLDVAARVACLGVCRAWRAGLRGGDRWCRLEFRTIGRFDDRLLRLLLPHFDFVELFYAVPDARLYFEDVAYFVWCTGPASALDPAKRSFIVFPKEGEEVNLCQLQDIMPDRRRVHVPSLLAPNGVDLLSYLQTGSYADWLTLDDHDDKGWTRRDFLSCLQLYCARFSPPPGADTSLQACAAFQPPAAGSLLMQNIAVNWLAERNEPARRFAQHSPEEDAPFGDLNAAALFIGRAHLELFRADNCRLTRHFLPALAGLLRNGLRTLHLSELPQLLKPSRGGGASPVTLLAAAIRAAPKLARLVLRGVGARRQADVAALIDACAGHATLTHLSIFVCSHDGGQGDREAAAEVGYALSRLVASQRVPEMEIDFVSPYGQASRLSPAQSKPMWAALRRRRMRGGERLFAVRVDERLLVDEDAMDALAAGLN